MDAHSEAEALQKIEDGRARPEDSTVFVHKDKFVGSDKAVKLISKVEFTKVWRYFVCGMCGVQWLEFMPADEDGPSNCEYDCAHSDGFNVEDHKDEIDKVTYKANAGEDTVLPITDKGEARAVYESLMDKYVESEELCRGADERRMFEAIEILGISREQLKDEYKERRRLIAEGTPSTGESNCETPQSSQPPAP